MYLKSDTLLLTDIFETFRKMCLETYQLDPVNFLWDPGLTCQEALRTIKIELELLTDIYMLLMVEK